MEHFTSKPTNFMYPARMRVHTHTHDHTWMQQQNAYSCSPALVPVLECQADKILKLLILHIAPVHLRSAQPLQRCVYQVSWCYLLPASVIENSIRKCNSHEPISAPLSKSITNSRALRNVAGESGPTLVIGHSSGSRTSMDKPIHISFLQHRWFK